MDKNFKCKKCGCCKRDNLCKKIMEALMNHLMFPPPKEKMKLKQKSQITERTKKILEDRKQGKSIDDLAGFYNISRSRIYQILKDYGDTLPERLAVHGE